MDELTDPFLINKERFNGSVLVTGASGCLGSWVISILSRSGIPIVAADLTPDPARAALILGDKAARALNWQVCDVTSDKHINDLVSQHNVQAIIHLAGLQVPFCAANPAQGARVNVEGTINILEAARNAGLNRTVFASSVAACAFPQGGPWKETLYGAYKLANEQTAFVYWSDWQIPSVCLRPNVVYGIARDQGMSSKNTIAIQAAAWGTPYQIPFAGTLSWLYAGEAAAAFIAAVSQDGKGTHIFDLNGSCESVENGIQILNTFAPEAQISCSGSPFPFPADLDDSPLREHVMDYPMVTPTVGIEATYKAFTKLKKQGRLPALPGTA